MYTEPIKDKLEQVMSRKDTLVTLIKAGWTDGAIANYFGSDKITIRRARKLHEEINAVRKETLSEQYYRSVI